MSSKLVVLLLLGLAACGGQTQSQGGGGQLSSEGNLLPPVILGGAGDQETTAFHLNHANYKVTWSVTPPNSQGCNFKAVIKAEDATETPVTDGRIEGAQQTRGAQEVGELADGKYTMLVTTECAWRMAVTAH